MKLLTLLFTATLLFATDNCQAQSDSSVVPWGFVVFSPLELGLFQLKVGTEFNLSENTSAVFEVQSYHWNTDELDNLPVWGRGGENAIALKTDLRFYRPARNPRHRAFRGVNVMAKRVNWWRWAPSNVFALNYKAGKEYRISKGLRCDAYYGFGIRYKDIGNNPIVFRNDRIYADVWEHNIVYPNVLLGCSLKF